MKKYGTMARDSRIIYIYICVFGPWQHLLFEQLSHTPSPKWKIGIPWKVLPSVCLHSQPSQPPVADAFSGSHSASHSPSTAKNHPLDSRPPPSPDDGRQGTHHFGQLTANIRWRRFGDIILLEATFSASGTNVQFFPIRMLMKNYESNIIAPDGYTVLPYPAGGYEQRKQV